jgi:hypothetical protein
MGMKKGEEKIKKKEKNLTLWSKLQTPKSKQHKTLENTTSTTLNLCEQSEKNVRGRIRVEKCIL